MAREPGADVIYDVAAQFRSRCLGEGQSLLWPDHRWSDETLENVAQSLNFDSTVGGEAKNTQAWADALSAYDASTVMTAVDLDVFFYLFPTADKKNKWPYIQPLFSGRNDIPEIAPRVQEQVLDALSRGIRWVPPAYRGDARRQLKFIVLFIQNLRADRTDVEDVEAVIDTLERSSPESGRVPMAATLIPHLLFPDHFESISFLAERTRILKAFSSDYSAVMHESILEHDRELARIRADLSNNGEDETFSWWRPDIRARWDDRIKSGTQHPRIVKIAPGPDAKYWNDCLSNNIICLGWDTVGDLSRFASYEEFYPTFSKEYALEYGGNASTVTTKAKEVWTLRELEPGDRIVANKGTSRVLAVGTVIEPGYRWDPTRPEFRQTVSVDWDTTYAQDIPTQGGWAFVTVSEVAPDLWKLIESRGASTDKTSEISRKTELFTGYDEPTFGEIVTRLDPSLHIDPRTLRRYHLSLRTRKFVILSGPSGTGKTWLATAWAEAAGAKSLVTPVAPNWTTNEDLLGYLSPLTDRYIDTDFSRFLREAAAEQAKADDAGVLATPYHLVLDEMNLARVEYYFARFLSAMERRVRGEAATIELGTESVLLPDNLVVIGTVNIDETTHGFADKVYDRAQLIELGIDRALLAGYVAGQPHAEALLEAWDHVAAVKPFAFRIAREFKVYIEDARSLNIPWEDAFDEQLMQKVLPRLTGADPLLIKALEALQDWAAGRYPLSHARITQMLDRSRHTGIVSYFG